jgi:hypothetical protein
MPRRLVLVVALLVLACAGTAQAAPLQWADSPVPIDNLRPGDGRHVTSASCPSRAFCVAIDARGGVMVTRAPEAGLDAWKFTPVVPERVLVDVDCPASSLCVAVGEAGTIATSTDPAGGRWKVVRVGSERLGMVECPTTGMCIAADFSGNLYTSTAPAGGATGWNAAETPHLSSLSCPAADLCVAASFTGVVTSTDPGNGPSWTYAELDGNDYAQHVACGSPSLCVVTGTLGSYATSTNPTGGTAAWSVSKFNPQTDFEVVCASNTLCVASEFDGETTFVSKNPGGGPSTWMRQSLPTMRPLACAGNSTFCVATDDSPRGTLLTSADPARGVWNETDFDRLAVNALGDIACPAPALCLAVDEAGRVLSSGNPSGPLEAWAEEADLSGLGAGSLEAIACPTVAFCVAGDHAGRLFMRDGAWRLSRPADGPAIHDVDCASPDLCVAVDNAERILRWSGGAWSVVHAAYGLPLRGVACPSAALCVAVGERGAALVSTDGAATWSERRVTTTDTPLHQIACPAVDLCVAAGLGGLLVTLAPAADWSWRLQGLEGSLAAVDCSSVSLCVAADVDGQVYSSSDPFGGRSAWTDGPQAPAQPTGLACAGDAVCVMVDRDGFAWSATGTGVPFSTSPPAVTAADGTLRCSGGEWSPAPDSLRYQWEWADGSEIAGATTDTYSHSRTGTVHCRVTAANAAGEATARGTITVAPPPRAPAPGSPRPPASGRLPFSARIEPRIPRIASLRRSGLPVTVTCSRRCTVTLRLTLDARDSRRLRLRRGATIGTARATLARSGSVTARVRLTAAARRAVTRARPKRLRVTLSARVLGRQRAVTGGGPLTLRR